jgi:hypothetical protein
MINITIITSTILNWYKVHLTAKVMPCYALEWSKAHLINKYNKIHCKQQCIEL